MLLKLHYIPFTSKDKAKREKASLSIPSLFRGTWICFMDISVKSKVITHDKDPFYVHHKTTNLKKQVVFTYH